MVEYTKGSKRRYRKFVKVESKTAFLALISWGSFFDGEGTEHTWTDGN